MRAALPLRGVTCERGGREQGRRDKEKDHHPSLHKQGRAGGGKPSPEFPFRGNYRPRHWPGAHCLPLFGKGGRVIKAPMMPGCLLARAPFRCSPRETSLFALRVASSPAETDGGGDDDDLT